MTNQTTTIPDPATLTKAPLRNRMRVELSASTAEVWDLVGNLERYPEYSAGLERVSVTKDSQGRCTEYVCHFRPQEPNQPSISHREVVRWVESGRGYASLAAEPNDFALSNCLTMVTLETLLSPALSQPTGNRTVLTWTQHFDAPDIAAQKAIFDEALADIGGQLAKRFGGKVTERFVEPPG